MCIFSCKSIVAVVVLFIVLGSFYYVYTKGPKNASTVVILNGPSASGKSSIQEAFIRKMDAPWVKIGIDNFFVGVLSKYYIYGEYKPSNPAYKIMEGIPTEDEHKNPVFTLKVGPAGEKIIDGMNHAVKAYADAGNNIIIDYIAYEPAWLENLVALLKGHKVIVVKVTLPLEILEQREAGRATSPRGHGRSHYDTVHQHKVTYDLEIDSSKVTPDEAADAIGALLK